MAFECRIVADSLAPNGKRLTSFEVTYPLIVHGEHLRHRSQSFSVKSNRAIPTQKVINEVLDDPFIPFHWGLAQKGMVADNVADEALAAQGRAEWLRGRDHAVAQATKLMEMGFHKQVVNRILSPFQWVTVLCTATEWDNFWYLRLSPSAEPHMNKIAQMMRECYLTSKPKELQLDEWHLPYIWYDEEHLPIDIKLKLSPPRCARVSFMTHLGTREHEKDFELHDKLKIDVHMSPFEHQGTPHEVSYYRSGNFQGFVQHRQLIPNHTYWKYEG